MSRAPEVMTYSAEEQVRILAEASMIFREHASVLARNRHRSSNMAARAKILGQQYDGATEAARILTLYLLTIQPPIQKRGERKPTPGDI